MTWGWICFQHIFILGWIIFLTQLSKSCYLQIRWNDHIFIDTSICFHCNCRLFASNQMSFWITCWINYWFMSISSNHLGVFTSSQLFWIWIWISSLISLIWLDSKWEINKYHVILYECSFMPFFTTKNIDNGLCAMQGQRSNQAHRRQRNQRLTACRISIRGWSDSSALPQLWSHHYTQLQQLPYACQSRSDCVRWSELFFTLWNTTVPGWNR